MNPHIWSNIHNASIIAKHISSELTKKDPKHKEYFEKNLTSFKTNLDSLKNDFLKNTKDKNQVNFIVFHDAYGYLFKELGVNETKKHIFRANVVSDPNSAQMKELIDDIKKENIKVAFREPQLNSSNLEKLASEYNLKIFVLDPL
jgi:zinc transport system substrate-binding protein